MVIHKRRYRVIGMYSALIAIAAFALAYILTNVFMALAWALFAGLCCFLVSILLLALKAEIVLDKQSRSIVIVEKHTGLEIIGIIPHYEMMQSNSNYNQFRDKLLYHMLLPVFQNANKQQQKILITCIHPGEGKGSISNIISEWLIEKGKKCTVVIPYLDDNNWWLKHKNTSGYEDVTVESLAINDVVLMVLPPLVFDKYPLELVRDFNMALLVCNADRKWSPDDQNILDSFMEKSELFLQIILNKAEKEVVEDVLNKIDLKYSDPDNNTVKHTIQRENKTVTNIRKAKKFIKNIPTLTFIFDKNQNIVYANETITSLLNFSEIDKTMNRCIKSRQYQEESCTVKTLIGGQLVTFNIKMTCSLFVLKDEDYYVIINISNIKGENDKQNELIKKIKTTAATSYEQMSALNDFIEKVENAGRLGILLEKMKEGNEDVIEFYRLVSAENGALTLHLSTQSAFELLENAVISVLEQPIAQNREIAFIPPFPLTFVHTDSVILEQILRTMLRNAFEAEPEGAIVQTGYEKMEGAIKFYVFNNKCIPKSLQNQIFEKGFTTQKGKRGLGTYGMKLFGEQYLKGHVGFKSDEETGTQFYISIPFETPPS